MGNESTAAGVALRFEEEQHYITRYIAFLRARTTVHDRQIDDINGILVAFSIDQLPKRSRRRASETFSDQELQELLAPIAAISLRVESAISTHLTRLDSTPAPRVPRSGPVVEYDRLLGEAIDWALANTSEGADDTERANVLERAMHEYDRNDNIAPRAQFRTLMKYAIAQVPRIKILNRIDSLQYVLDQFSQFELQARSTLPKAEINVLRQGFVLLMTAFDAAIFDLMRIALHRRFFDLIGLFGKNEKITLHEIADFGGFGALRDGIIEDQLKRRYVKDLLFLFQEMGAACTNNKGEFIKVIELVLRRNLYVHNRGIVDERYLEKDGDKSKYNICGFALGDTAVIDDTYWNEANSLTSQVIENVTNWVSGATRPSPARREESF
jgi:hypothetical protein